MDTTVNDNFISLDEIEENKTDINYDVINDINNELDTVTCIILTSGTSGYNKAVKLTHRNICSNLNAIVKFNVVQKDEGNFVSILPLYHGYELFCDAMLII